MRSLLALLFAATTLAAAPRPEGAVTFQAYDRLARQVATHTVVPPPDASNLSPTQFFSKLESASGRDRPITLYWLGPIYRYNHDKPADFVFYDGKIGKTSTLLMKDLEPGDVILIYVDSR
ncbi:MAG: hypothetical protein QOK24_222 [Verrucomicrobiota bacterium]|jgi:hypothetical protein